MRQSSHIIFLSFTLILFVFSIKSSTLEINLLSLWSQVNQKLFSDHRNFKKYQDSLLFSKIKHVRKCNFTPTYYSTSSEHDAIVTFAINYLINLYPFVRSLRTTGCKAKIIILCDPVTFSDTQNYDQFSVIKSWGVTFIPFIGKSTNRRANVYYSKIKAYLGFTYTYGHLFDRLFFCDLADISFQIDPFFELQENKVYSFYEDLPIKLEAEAQSQLRSYFNITSYDENLVISGMAFYGSPNQILMLLEKLFLYLLDGSQLVDQTIVNYLYYNNLYYPIHWSILKPEGTIIALQIYQYNSYKFGHIIPNNHSLIPRVLHHMHYSIDALKSLYKACPRTVKDNRTPYMLLLTNQELDELDVELAKDK